MQSLNECYVSDTRAARVKMCSHSLIFHANLFLLLLIVGCQAQLRVDYYRNTCPNVESIVRSAVENKLQQTFVTAPATLRLFFHDCFVRGCDASVMLATRNSTSEKDNPINLSLAGDGFDTVIKAKNAVDSVPGCQNKVSCADILAMATRDVVALAGGPSYTVELGRLDGRLSTKASVRHHVPHPEFTLERLNQMFASHGLTHTDLVALSGAHTIGFSHCNQFSERIYNFRRRKSIDHTLNPAYAKQLQQVCPKNVDPRLAIGIDPVTPRTFDNQYYKSLQQGRGLLASDQALFTHKRTRDLVNLFASNNTAFEVSFVSAMTKLGRIGVKTGNQGEIRRIAQWLTERLAMFIFRYCQILLSIFSSSSFEN